MRMWEIREGDTEKGYRFNRRMPSHMKGYKDDEKELQEAYDCGFEDGWKAAMDEFKMKGERSMR